MNIQLLWDSDDVWWREFYRHDQKIVIRPCTYDRTKFGTNVAITLRLSVFDIPYNFWMTTQIMRKFEPWKIYDSGKVLWYGFAHYYAALLPRRGPHIASHSVRPSVCPSVCPSVPWLFTLEHRSRVFVNLADVRYLLFCLHVRAAYSTAISAAQACFFYDLTQKCIVTV